MEWRGVVWRGVVLCVIICRERGGRRLSTSPPLKPPPTSPPTAPAPPAVLPGVPAVELHLCGRAGGAGHPARHDQGHLPLRDPARRLPDGRVFVRAARALGGWVLDCSFACTSCANTRGSWVRGEPATASELCVTSRPPFPSLPAPPGLNCGRWDNMLSPPSRPPCAFAPLTLPPMTAPPLIHQA